MRVLGSYLKLHRGHICLLGLYTAIFVVIFYLYNMRTDAVLYAFLVSFICLLIFGTLDFIRYCRRHRQMLDLRKIVTGAWEEFPRAEGKIEEDYQSIVGQLYQLRCQLESEYTMGRQDMIDFYSLWVHQIKTPIAAMQILLQSVEAQDGMGGLVYIKELKLELFKIEQYVEMVLSYLRIEEMSSDLVLQWYPLAGIARQAVRKYSQMFILQKIKLNFHEGEHMVLTDEKWLLLVIEQILSNALKYTKQGSISIYTLAEKQSPVLVIEDTGIGIQREDLPRVFEKGFTGYNGRTDKKSTGIGLYLCKCVMDKLNHSIYMESEVGKGTKVYLALGRKELNPE